MTAPLEGARGPAATGPAAQGTTDTADSARQADDLQGAKLQSTYAALLALHGGYSLHELAGGGFLIARWDRTVHTDLAGVKAFLARLGVRA